MWSLITNHPEKLRDNGTWKIEYYNHTSSSQSENNHFADIGKMIRIATGTDKDTIVP